MRGRKAARYARWSASVALMLLLMVVGVYLHRRRGETARIKNAPPPVPPAVQQESSEFTYSKTVGPRTLFTIRASRATEYKEQDRSLLEDVAITIYGRKGDRDDTVHARECSFVPDTGVIRCQGVVQIDLRSAKLTAAVNDRALHVETSDISFDRDTGVASSPNVAKLQFCGGEGQGTGLLYDTNEQDVKLERDVELELTSSAKRKAQPVRIKGSALEFLRNRDLLILSGPADAQQDGRTLRAGRMEVELDSSLHPRRLVASESPQIDVQGARGTAMIAAEEMEASLGPAGSIEQISADGHVRATENGKTGETSFSAGHAVLKLAASEKISEPRELDADGNVQADEQQNGASRRLTTAALRLLFAPNASRRSVRLASAETLGPGEITSSQRDEASRIQAGKLTAQFDTQSRLTHLDGADGAQVVQQKRTGEMQKMTAQNLMAAIAPDGEWQTIEEQGRVKFQQGNRIGSAERATITRTPNEIVLGGAASVRDNVSDTSAERIEINNSTGETHASGKVVSSFMGNETGEASGESERTSAAGPVTHISADDVKASNATGHAVYLGHARMWQGDVVVDADTIQIWRTEKRFEARGNVVGVFPQAPARKASSASNSLAKPSVPVVWQIRAPKMDYWNGSGKVELTGGVDAQSAIGMVSARKMDLYLAATGGKQQLERAVGGGGVQIEQSGRIGTAEQGQYTASAGKFVLSGGDPTLKDASGNMTKGRELTFFLANDTILVDSPKGTRTVTKRRVEK